MDVEQIVALIAGPLGALSLLILGFVALVTKHLVLGWQYNELQERCNRLEDTAFQNLELAKRLASLNEEYLVLIRQYERETKRRE